MSYKLPLPRVSIERIAQDEKDKEFYLNPSDMLSYQEFVSYFRNLEIINLHNFVIGANFAYGWMPTILEIKKNRGELSETITILNAVKKGKLIDREALTNLRDTINNSLVGASKLLHFVNPDVYAIWDSRVYKYITGKIPYDYQIKDMDYYLSYLKNCEDIAQDPAFPPVHASINHKIGYIVTPYRAIELVMYINGK